MEEEWRRRKRTKRCFTSLLLSTQKHHSAKQCLLPKRKLSSQKMYLKLHLLLIRCDRFLRSKAGTCYCSDRVSPCNTHAVQQDTQSVLISEFIHHVCQLDIFRTPPVHHQERFTSCICRFGMW